MTTRGLGAAKEEEMPLSVPGQVHRLIEEALMEENLGIVYVCMFIVNVLTPQFVIATVLFNLCDI